MSQRSAWAAYKDPISRNRKRAGNMAHTLECMSVHEALGSIPERGMEWGREREREDAEAEHLWSCSRAWEGFSPEQRKQSVVCTPIIQTLRGRSSRLAWLRKMFIASLVYERLCLKKRKRKRKKEKTERDRGRKAPDIDSGVFTPTFAYIYRHHTCQHNTIKIPPG